MPAMSLQAISYTPKPNSLSILDQLLLPHRTTYVPIKNADDAFKAIRSMRVRGAPAIAIVAALSVCAEIRGLSSSPPTLTVQKAADNTADWIRVRLQFLLGSRPTAVNLRDAVDKLTLVTGNARDRAVGSQRSPEGATAHVYGSYIAAAEQMLEDDVRDNQRMGRNGAEWVAELAPSGTPVSVLTHCNTGYAGDDAVGCRETGLIEGSDRSQRPVMERHSASCARCTHQAPCDEHTTPKHGHTTKARA